MNQLIMWPLQIVIVILVSVFGGLTAALGYEVPGFTPDQVIEYKETFDSSGNPVTLTMDVFYPEGHQPTDSRPAIVFFFGGGWVSGSKSHFHPHCEYLASRGMVAVSADYRVSSVHGTTPQECVKDGKSAVRFLRGNAAALGIDPNRIVASGGSAGGHVAAATGTLTAYEEPGEDLGISSKPNAMVLFNPVYDNGPGGYGYDTVEAYWEDISPLHNIAATTPPAVVFLGTNDSLVPVATARNFQALMEAEGIRSDLHLYQDQPHSFFNYDVVGDSSGPFYGYRATVFRMDEFLVSLGYLSDPHPDPDPVTGWVTIFGDTGFSSGSEATSSPVTTDANTDSIAANIDPVTLADGDFIRMTGTVTFDQPIPAGHFRIGLFDGDDPVTAGDGTGYVGIWSEAPATSSAGILAGDGTGSSHPFETVTGTLLGPTPAADVTVPANTPVAFSLMVARNGSNLDITTTFEDGGNYHSEQNLLNQAVVDYDYNSVAFLMTGILNASQGSFSNIEVTSGATLPMPTTSTGEITYVDAVEGASGNTYATGGSLADTSWIDTVSNAFGTDDSKWMKRFGGTPGWTQHNGGDVIQGAVTGFPNGVPEITTEITDLPDGTYEVWVFFWEQIVSGVENWVIDAGLTSGSLASYSSSAGPVAGSDSATPVNAATLSFSNAPAVVAAGGNQNMFGVNLGQVVVTGGSSIKVHIDKLFGSGTSNRTIYDGVGYRLADDPVEEIEWLEPPVMAVDFNNGDALGAPSQSGCRVVAGSTTQANNSDNYVKTIGAHTVTIMQPDGAKFEFRGANGDSSRDIPGGDTSVSYLVADFIATRKGAIDIDITGLAAGDYLFRSRHLDTFNGSALGFAQGVNTTTPNTIEAFLGLVLMDSVQPTALGSAGLNTTFIDDGQIPMLEFPISHDGSSPLTIKLRSTQSNGVDSFLLLNGFEVFQPSP